MKWKHGILIRGYVFNECDLGLRCTSRLVQLSECMLDGDSHGHALVHYKSIIMDKLKPINCVLEGE